MAKTLSKVFGVVFLVIGVLGFFNDPLLGLFEVDTVHNIAHIVLGLVLLAAPGVGALRGVAVVYLVLAVLGFLMVDGDGELLGLVHVNAADNWLHLVLAVLLFGASFAHADSAYPMPGSPAPMV
jgi:hypothetical protein